MPVQGRHAGRDTQPGQCSCKAAAPLSPPGLRLDRPKPFHDEASRVRKSDEPERLMAP